MGTAGGGSGGGGPGLVTGEVVRPGGRALLSWRVALLPYLGEEALYRQFRLDEPWDGPHNKRLLRRMPAVYAPPGGRARPYTTYYQVFVGEHAAFEKHRALRFPAAFADGLSNTLLIAEAGAAVPWTKPQDLPYAADDPLPELGGLFPGSFGAALGDGSVARFSTRADPEVLRAAITRDGGEAVDLDRIRVPGSRREAELMRQNERLRRALGRERARLEGLRREELRLRKQALPGAGEDAAGERLREENMRLERQLRQAREEAGSLEAEVRRLRRPPGPEH
jgi:hypothetical protein